MGTEAAFFFLLILNTSGLNTFGLNASALDSSGESASAQSASAPAGAKTDWDDYAWPTEAGRIVTSTFGEYRRTHFHAGIDISSGDVTGYGVFASRSGYVSRIRISPVGYGKILYIRHADGFTTTYAHLEKFAPAIDARAVREQRALGSYPVDIACAPTEFPVRKGDLVGLTGQTGAASPHLHFEIRDPDGNPVNPFLAPLLRVPDTIPPSIKRIAVSPLSPDATVDGGNTPRIFRAETVRGNSVHLPVPIVITGEAGFAVESSDRIPGSRFRNGVYTRALFIDGVPVYAARIDRTPWNEAHEIDLCFERSLPGAGGGRLAKLYMDSPNHLPFYMPHTQRAGIIDCASYSPGPHAFRILCTDFPGNRAEVTGTLVMSRIPTCSAGRSGDDIALQLFAPGDVVKISLGARPAGGSWSRREWYAPAAGFSPSLLLPFPAGRNGTVTVILENRWGTLSPAKLIASPRPGGSAPAIHLTCEAGEEYVRVHITAQGDLPSPPSVTVGEGTGRSTVIMSAAGPDEYTGWFRPREEYRGTRHIVAETSSPWGRASDSAAIDIEPVLPGTTGVIAADGGKLLIRYDSLSVLKPLFLRIEKSSGEEGPVYALDPEGTVLGSGLTASIRPGTPGEHRGLYYRTRGSWQFIGSRGVGEEAACTGRVSGTLGEVTLLADSTPPAVVQVSALHHAGREPEIIVRFRDDRSGVEYDSLKMYIDGNMVIPEIDGRRHRAVYKAIEPLGRGPHLMTIRLTDRIGNSSTTQRRFVLP
jgi:hypothetical protein